MMNRIKKVLLATLATLTVIGNTTSAPLQATECSEAVKVAPITKVIDCNDLTEEMLTTRADHNVMYIERIIGKVTDNEKNGIVLNPPEDGGYYISYASDRGYIPVGKEIKEPYRGKYGRGYIIKRNNPRSNRFYLKDYYIREVVER